MLTPTPRRAAEVLNATLYHVTTHVHQAHAEHGVVHLELNPRDALVIAEIVARAVTP
jgi:hypothetical protein